MNDAEVEPEERSRHEEHGDVTYSRLLLVDNHLLFVLRLLLIALFLCLVGQVAEHWVTLISCFEDEGLESDVDEVRHREDEHHQGDECDERKVNAQNDGTTFGHMFRRKGLMNGD